MLAAGHMSPPEIFAVFKAAREAGVQKLLVLHPEFVVNLTDEQARELAQMGAFIEHEVSMYYRERPEWPIDKLVNWINAVGAEHTTLGSDTGQATSPLPSEVFGKVAHAAGRQRRRRARRAAHAQRQPGQSARHQGRGTFPSSVDAARV